MPLTHQSKSSYRITMLRALFPTPSEPNANNLAILSPDPSSNSFVYRHLVVRRSRLQCLLRLRYCLLATFGPAAKISLLHPPIGRASHGIPTWVCFVLSFLTVVIYGNEVVAPCVPDAGLETHGSIYTAWAE